MALALAAAAWAAVTALTGGFAIVRLRVSSRDLLRPLVAAVVFAAVARAALGAGEFRRLSARIAGAERAIVTARIAALAATAVLIVAIAWNTRAAGGSDSSCYVLQAEAFAHGRIALDRPLADVLPDAPPAAFAPAGFVPSPRGAHEPVPICGPGLALAMALPLLISREAVFLVVPVAAALVVWLTFVFGRRLDDEVTGAAAAVLLACSPIVLYQSVQPMSDVPAAALCLAALTAAAGRSRHGDLAAGVLVSLAILVRANLAVIGLPLVWLLATSGGGETDAAHARLRRLARFAIAAAPGCALMAVLGGLRYGSPLASGYGSTDVLFSSAHLWSNVARYPSWLIATQTPFILLGLLAPMWIARHRARASLAIAAIAFSILLVATYLFYTVFDDWWYIRFLLPALPIVLVFSVAVALDALPRRRGPAAIAICAVLIPWQVQIARARQVFDLQALESRFRLTGAYAAQHLPGRAVVLSVQQSGSVRYHGDRQTIAWDAISVDRLDATLERLRTAAHPPYLALEEEEEARFRARFPGQRFGRLDWPPMAEIRAPVHVRIYDPAAR
jgi:dolichyl-phosphate-mannose-protein mannosyltransferase